MLFTLPIRRKQYSKGIFYSLFLALIIWLALLLGAFLRLKSAPKLSGQFIGPDAYRLFRQSRLIVENGKLPEVDTMRWVPEGVSIDNQLPLFPYILAYSFKSLHAISSSITLKEVATFYPVVAFAAAEIIFFFLVRLIFGKACAMLSTIAFSTIPTLPATIAGYADRDTLTLFLTLDSIHRRAYAGL